MNSATLREIKVHARRAGSAWAAGQYLPSGETAVAGVQLQLVVDIAGGMEPDFDFGGSEHLLSADAELHVELSHGDQIGVLFRINAIEFEVHERPVYTKVACVNLAEPAFNRTNRVLLAVITELASDKLDSQESRIRRQLAAVPADPNSGWSLEPVNSPSPVEAGWNRLVETARHWKLLSQLEQHVECSLAEVRSSGNRLLLDALADGIAVTDESGTITQANVACASLSGSDLAEMPGRSIFD